MSDILRISKSLFASAIPKNAPFTKECFKHHSRFFMISTGVVRRPRHTFEKFSQSHFRQSKLPIIQENHVALREPLKVVCHQT
ncbi:hypothetical protein Hanom_Chr02g00105471 [Helianthus anomalus]